MIRSLEVCDAAYRFQTRKRVIATSLGNDAGVTKLSASQRNGITLYIGEVAASDIATVLDTLLGSCVAVCLYDPEARVGGMNHILLPICHSGDDTPRYGVHAMELLINQMMKLGGDRRRFVAKAFGGGTVIRGSNFSPVGEANSHFVRAFLANENIPLLAERLGGDHAVHLYFHTNTGKATVHTVDGSILPKIMHAERALGNSRSTDQNIISEITLF